MKWILIIIVLGTGKAIDHIDLYSKESCYNAVKQIKTMANVEAYCLETPR